MDIYDILKLLNDTWASPEAVAAVITAAVPVVAGAIVAIIKAINYCDCKNGRTHSRFTGKKFKEDEENEEIEQP